MLQSRLLPAILAVTLALATPVWAAGDDVSTTANAEINPVQLAALEAGAPAEARQTQVPSVLSAMDESLYRMALDFAARNQWNSAERVLARVRDPLLVGHILAQHYLTPGVKTNAVQLKSWMTRYADLPEAESVYGLVRKTLGPHPKGIATPTSFSDNSTLSDANDEDATWEDFTVDDSDRGLSKSDARKLAAFKSRFRAKLKNDDYDVIASLKSPEALRLLSHADADELKTVLARSLFDDGRDKEALPWAQEAATRSGQILPAAHWLAGLIQWRLGHPAEAAQQFQVVANNAQLSSWMIASGAYWAARANLASGKPETVNHWLEQAALYPRTLYGMLARRALGLDIEYSWIARPFTDADAQLLERVPGARRALALIQVGDAGDAEDELKHLTFGATKSLSRAMLALAHATAMPDLAVSLSEIVSAQDGRPHDTTDYPLPSWRPTGGWTVDRALILAIVRQESAFNPRAKSSAGALGLMQVMPATAKLLGGKGKLTDPEANLAIGQDYVRKLLANQSINGNLVYLAACYNSGPGNVVHWQQTLHTGTDPLLFLESIPMHETRVFTERVLMNFWAYRDRFGEHSNSIDALAAGSWPLYDAPASGGEAARNDEN